MTMICGQCGKYGIHWIGPWGNLTGTKCPHCGGENCQRADSYTEDELEKVKCPGCGEWGEPNGEDGEYRCGSGYQGGCTR